MRTPEGFSSSSSSHLTGRSGHLERRSAQLSVHCTDQGAEKDHGGLPGLFSRGLRASEAC